MKKILSIILISISTFAWSQYAEPEERDTTKVRYLDEVVVSANRVPEQRRSVAQQIFVIRPSTIKSFNGQTTADLLQNFHEASHHEKIVPVLVSTKAPDFKNKRNKLQGYFIYK